MFPGRRMTPPSESTIDLPTKLQYTLKREESSSFGQMRLAVAGGDPAGMRWANRKAE